MHAVSAAVSHTRPTLRILTEQQSDLPPGRLEHPLPPQAPHWAAQHMAPRIIPRAQKPAGGEGEGGGGAEAGSGGDPPPAACAGLTHATSAAKAHARPTLRMATEQQSAVPPSRLAQPFPPHAPHLAAQHDLPVAIPLAQKL